jgi:hypothetical protein
LNALKRSPVIVALNRLELPEKILPLRLVATFRATAVIPICTGVDAVRAPARGLWRMAATCVYFSPDLQQKESCQIVQVRQKPHIFDDTSVSIS